MAEAEDEEWSIDDWENVGPLTTVFSPAPSCSTNFIYSGNSNEPEVTSIEVNVWKEECYPRMKNTDGLPGLNGRYFSPGLCPSGWYSAQDYSTMFHGAPSLVSGESVAICCPSGYTPTFEPVPFPEFTQGSCQSALQSKVTAQPCDDCTDSTVLDTTNPVNGKRMTAYEGTLMIRWQASDLPILSAAAAAASPTKAPSTTSDNQASSTGSKRTSATRSDEPSAGSTPIGSGSQYNPSTGLSTAAKAGIGAGIAVLAILAMLLLAVYLLRRKKQKKIARSLSQNPDGPRELHEDTVEKAELPTSAEHLGPKELETEAPLRELATSEPPTRPELPGEGHAVLTTSELPADVHGGEALQGYHTGTPKGDYYPSSPAAAELDGQVWHSQSVSPQGNYYSSAQATGPRSPAVSENASSPVAFYSPTENIDEYARLQEEEARLATRRTVLQETLSLIQEDERLRAEQEAVRRRLEELRKGTKGG